MTKQRILLKLSGESLSETGSLGYSQPRLSAVSKEIARAADQIELAIVLGAGNLVRGATLKSAQIEDSTADQMGILATVLNALALQDSLIAEGVEVYATSAIGIPGVIDQFNHRKVMAKLRHGYTVICAGGTGNPFVTTDSAASLRAAMLKMDLILKATKVDGVYNKDPVKYPDAQKYDTLEFSEALQKELKVMDLSAFVQCRDHNIPIRVFDMIPEGALSSALLGQALGTLIKNK